MAWVDGGDAALLTDLYELTMAASYYARGMDEPATFDLFVRSLPPQRNFLIACGIEDALDFLEGLHFDGEAIEYLDSLQMFAAGFLDWLRGLRFRGEVRAVDEGEAVFAGEPILSVTASLIEAQVAETFLLNCVTFQTVVASKAARVALACRGRPFVDFSARRDHGADAALKGARAAFIGGAAATSDLLAGRTYGIPVSGTMAHSYVQAFGDEAAAFRAFAADFPGRAVLLVDTFESVEGARRAAVVAAEARAAGRPVIGVRLDSGDLAGTARRVRAVLDEAGCTEVQIFASGDLDEYRIAALLAEGAPVDGFGVGTRLGTSEDAPSLATVYKLVEYDGRSVVKLSRGKETYPGRKQVYRFSRQDVFARDVIALADEPRPAAVRPLLVQAMSGGRRIRPREGIEAARDRCEETLRCLPEPLKALAPADPPYQVRSSAALRNSFAVAARAGKRR